MIRIGVVCFAMGVILCAQPAPDHGLAQVARTATVMLDGDLCKRIETPRSAKMLLEKDPRDPWKAGDNFDVNDEAFIAVKKTLMRLARLCPQVCDLNLWMPVAADPSRIQILVRNVHEMSQFWKWGDLHQAMPPEMKKVLESGHPVTVQKRPEMISILTPVRDSLGDVVGVVEVVSRASVDPRENVK